MKVNGDPLFLVGTQRSGTTWVANVVNRSREVALFFEPFQKGLGLFDAFPEEPVYLESASKSLIDSLLSQHGGMVSRAERFYPQEKWKRLAAGKLVDKLYNLSRTGLSYRSGLVRQLRVTQQWHGDKVWEHLVHKEPPLRPFVKETRLHLKVPVLFQTFPHTRIALLLRHPYPVIVSILKWFERRSLSELKRKLEYIFDVYNSQNFLDARERELVDLALKGSIEDKLLAQWFISNDRAVAFCESNEIAAKIFVYEALCKNPLKQFEEMFEFYGLEFEAPVKEYILNSSSQERAASGVVDTRKNSGKKYSEWLDDISNKKLYEKIKYYGLSSRAYKYALKEY